MILLPTLPQKRRGGQNWCDCLLPRLLVMGNMPLLLIRLRPFVTVVKPPWWSMKLELTRRQKLLPVAVPWRRSFQNRFRVQIVLRLLLVLLMVLLIILLFVRSGRGVIPNSLRLTFSGRVTLRLTFLLTQMGQTLLTRL